MVKLLQEVRCVFAVPKLISLSVFLPRSSADLCRYGGSDLAMKTLKPPTSQDKKSHYSINSIHMILTSEIIFTVHIASQIIRYMLIFKNEIIADFLRVTGVW